jgi:hypothetical protein
LGASWSINGRLGGFRMKMRTHESGNAGVADSGNHGGLQYGLGVGYRMNEHWRVQLDWTRYEEVDLGLTFGGGIGVFSFGQSELTSLGVEYHW